MEELADFGAVPIQLDFYVDSLALPYRYKRSFYRKEGWVLAARCCLDTYVGHHETIVYAACSEQGRILSRWWTARLLEMECGYPKEAYFDPPPELFDIADMLYWDFLGSCDVANLSFLEQEELETERKLAALEKNANAALTDADRYISSLARQRRNPDTDAKRRKELTREIDLVNEKIQSATSWIRSQIKSIRKNAEETEQNVLDSLSLHGEMETLYIFHWRTRSNWRQFIPKFPLQPDERPNPGIDLNSEVSKNAATALAREMYERREKAIPSRSEIPVRPAKPTPLQELVIKKPAQQQTNPKMGKVDGPLVGNTRDNPDYVPAGKALKNHLDGNSGAEKTTDREPQPSDIPRTETRDPSSAKSPQIPVSEEMSMPSEAASAVSKEKQEPKPGAHVARKTENKKKIQLRAIDVALASGKRMPDDRSAPLTKSGLSNFDFVYVDNLKSITFDEIYDVEFLKNTPEVLGVFYKISRNNLVNKLLSEVRKGENDLFSRIKNSTESQILDKGGHDYKSVLKSICIDKSIFIKDRIYLSKALKDLYQKPEDEAYPIPVLTPSRIQWREPSTSRGPRKNKAASKASLHLEGPSPNEDKKNEDGGRNAITSAQSEKSEGNPDIENKLRAEAAVERTIMKREDLDASHSVAARSDGSNAQNANSNTKTTRQSQSSSPNKTTLKKPATRVQIYTYGTHSDQIGRWGAVLVFGERRKELNGAVAHASSLKMALTALVRALAILNRPCAVDIFAIRDNRKKSMSLIDGRKLQNWLAVVKQSAEYSSAKQGLEAALQQHDVKWHDSTGSPVIKKELRKARTLAEEAMETFQKGK